MHLLIYYNEKTEKMFFSWLYLKWLLNKRAIKSIKTIAMFLIEHSYFIKTHFIFMMHKYNIRQEENT
ncbi:hypothetical protein BB020_08060 [Elizabethkingia occulta]|nr:hypothetical protein BB020_08060 [Elizabethkingia occulta]